MSFNFFILFWGLDKKNRITFFEPFNNPILVKMSSIFLQGSVSLQDWSKWNVCIFCCMANAHFWLYHSPVMAMALMADWIQAPPSIQPSDNIDWQADAAGVRSPGGPARQHYFYQQSDTDIRFKIYFFLVWTSRRNKIKHCLVYTDRSTHLSIFSVKNG